MKELYKIFKEAGLVKQKQPAWVKDEDTWNKAKKAVARGKYDEPWAVVTDIYKKMGGKVGKKEANSSSSAIPQLRQCEDGIKVKNWFYASEVYAKSAKESADKMSGEAKIITNPDPTAEEQALKILIDNPNMNVATFLNTLKSMGLAIIDTKKALESKKVIKKESNIKTTMHCRFMESQPNGVIHTNAYKFYVALIQEGLGNLRDAFYYTRQALESAVPAFEGKKCYADHPSRTDEVNRPERSVRDIVGHFENVHIKENMDGSASLCATLIMIPDEPFEWARSLVRHAVDYAKQYPDKEFIGLSINASGDAEPVEAKSFVQSGIIPDSAKTKIIGAIEQGLTQVRVVSAIHDAVSTDLVTEPGAKGEILSILESEKGK